MRLRALAFLAATTSCDIFAPGPAQPVKIDVPFCDPSAIGLTWAAVKNEGADWVYLTPTDGTASFVATSALTIAYGNSRDTHVYSATADELRDVSCLRQQNETKFLDGSVRDVAPDERFYVTVGATTVPSTLTFTVFVPDGPLDVVARTEKKNTALPGRIIVRHGVDLPVGSEIPVLDFASTEARPFDSANINVNGLGGQAFFVNAFRPPGSRHDLSFGLLGPSPTPYYAVPSSLLGPDDYHTFEVRIFSTSTFRELAYYYRRARDTQVTLGPDASTPSGSALSAGPCTRLQARIPAQPEYSSFVIVRFQANYGLGEIVVVEVGVTKEFLRQTPSTWTVEVPDLRRPDGSCLLRADPVSWSMSVTPQDGRIALHLGGKGRDGEVRRWSTVARP